MSRRADPSVADIERGAFPYPLTGGPTESPYLTWVRNRSNYMASRGLLDYLRAVGVLVRGVIVNFLVVLPYLLLVAIGLAYAHHWMLAHPYSLTAGILAGAVAWTLMFPVAIPIYKIVTYRQSVETGRESSVAQRDLYERSFGIVVAAVLAFAVFETLPFTLEYLHDRIELGELSWQGSLASLATVVAVFGSADRLLSRLRGMTRTVAMVLIGALGLLVPLAVILYVANFLVYSLPPSPLVLYSPLVVPIVGIIGIVIALPLGLRERAFARKELAALVGMLAAAAVLLAAVIALEYQASARTGRSLNQLDGEVMEPLRELAAGFSSGGAVPEMTPDEAALVQAFVGAQQEAASEEGALAEERRSLITLQPPRATGVSCEPPDDVSSRAPDDAGPTSIVARLRHVWYCWSYDTKEAEWEREWFSPRMKLITLAHRLSDRTDQRLAPLRRHIARQAYGRVVDRIAAASDADRVAELLRRIVVERYLSQSCSGVRASTPCATIGAKEPDLSRIVRERFRTAVADAGRFGNAIGRARKALERMTASEIAVLVSEKALYDRVASKFAGISDTAKTAQLRGKDELAKLLTASEMLDLVFEEHVKAGGPAQVHRAWFLQAALPTFPTDAAAAGFQRETRDTAIALAGLAAADSRSTESGLPLMLAFYYRAHSESGLTDPTSAAAGDAPTDLEIARAAGTRLAERALADLDLEHLKVLAFGLDDAKSDEEQRRTLAELSDEQKAQLNGFQESAILPLKDLVGCAFAVSRAADEASQGKVDQVSVFQWSRPYACDVLLAGRALAHDTEALAKLARAALIDRALDSDAADTTEREHVLDMFGRVPPELLGPEELARIAAANVVRAPIFSAPGSDPDGIGGGGLFDRGDAGADLATKTIFGVHGRLEQAGLGRVKADLTRALMPPKTIFVAVLAVVIWLGCWLTVDVNATSAHGLYRDRLAAAFLVGKDTKGDIAIEDDLDLNDVCRYDARSCAPYHLINVALNLQGSADAGVRDRQSDFFIFSKRFVGGARTGYCRSETLEQVCPQMSVAAAMAISAAAASPNMGRATSPLLVAFMTLMNIRLGFWMPHPGLLEDAAYEPARSWFRKRNRARLERPGFTFAEVFAAELEEIERRWEQAYADGRRRTDERREPAVGHGLVGLAFSGGGIRSAAFNLGVAQALNQAGAFDHVDYMSTVSGGGYVGSSISTLMRARESIVSEIDGIVTIQRGNRSDDASGRASPVSYMDIVVKGDAGGDTRTYRFAGHADPGVRDGTRVSAGQPLLKPSSAKGRSVIDGTVSVDTLAHFVTVVGAHERSEHRFSRLDSIIVKTGDSVRAGQDLIRRHDTLGERFRRRVRPTAFLREMRGALDETHRWVNLSDGGHIENLATIELLRRRCKYIIIGDGEADPHLHFAGLATLLRCASLDLGIDVDIDLDAMRLRLEQERAGGSVSERHWAVGTIRYPRTEKDRPREVGYLLYLKSSVTGDEGVMIREYRDRFPSFPHQSTADQFFDEDQFEAYRALGQHVAEAVLPRPAASAHDPATMSYDEFHAWFESLTASNDSGATTT